MAKNYFYIIFLSLFLSMYTAFAQDSSQSRGQEAKSIEGLSMYPNPVSGERVYITTLNEYSDKEIIIFDVLGKKMLHTRINTKELNISALPPGIYIVKINEGDYSSTRKLVKR